MTREENIKNEAMARLMKLFNCIKVVKYKYKGMPVDDRVNEGIKRDMEIAMDAVDTALKEEFYIDIVNSGSVAVVEVMDKTTKAPATGDRVFDVLKESVEKNEGK